MNDDPYKVAFGNARTRSYEEDQPGGPRGPVGPQAPVRPVSAHMEVFILYRPLMTCVFCKRRLFGNEEGEGESKALDPIPDNNEEYICPHTRLKDYQKLLARVAAGDVVLGTTTPTTLMNGVTQVLVSWAVVAQKK